ncbi:MAG TPA: hypothetical protein VGM07_07960 [Stellaceae bacterium]
MQLVALMLTGLELVPTGAHFFELWNKFALDQQQYFIIQQIYRGWAWFGIVLIAAIATNLAASMMLWRSRDRFWPSLTAGLLLAVTLAVFFVWTYPANQATGNWTTIPADWRALRRQWELSHAVNAVLTFAALGFAAFSMRNVPVRGPRR